MLDTTFGLAARIGELCVFAALDPSSRGTLGRLQLKAAFETLWFLFLAHALRFASLAVS